jgi:hypothetical protein
MNGLRLGLMFGALCFGAAQVSVAWAETAAPIDHWNTNAVMDALQALKATQINATTSEGRAVITARTRDGLNVGIYAKACDPAPPGVDAICHGLESIISFDPGPKVDRKALADRELASQFAIGVLTAQTLWPETAKK